MELAKTDQTENFKNHIWFLKIFPKYFVYSLQDFYDGPEIEHNRKVLVGLQIKYL